MKKVFPQTLASAVQRCYLSHIFQANIFFSSDNAKLFPENIYNFFGWKYQIHYPKYRMLHHMLQVHHIKCQRHQVCRTNKESSLLLMMITIDDDALPRLQKKCAFQIWGAHWDHQTWKYEKNLAIIAKLFKFVWKFMKCCDDLSLMRASRRCVCFQTIMMKMKMEDELYL